MQKDSIDKKLLAESFKDIHQDFEELMYLHNDILFKLKSFCTQLEHASLHITQDSYSYVRELADIITSYNTKMKKDFITIQKNIHDTPQTVINLKMLTEEKDKKSELLRVQQQFIGSLITATDYQSPSFLHSTKSLAGRQTGHIEATITDYKRYQHLDEKIYQSRFLTEYIDAFIKLPIYVFLTHTGMAAFTTILHFLIMEKKITGPLLIGKSLYFENKELVYKIAHSETIEVDEVDTENILKQISIHNPSILIFDTLCNAPKVSMPNIYMILEYVKKHAKKDVYVVLDNTCLSVGIQPIKQLLGKTNKVHVLIFESLNKYHQFGFDRQTGGIIYTFGKDTGRFFFARDRTGTNMSDNDVYTLPFPNRKLLTKRLERFERNTKELATHLDTYSKTYPTSPIDTIWYPGLTSHPSFNWSHNMFFHGSFFSIEFKPRFKKIHIYKRFIQLILTEAKKENMNIVSGTSFGMNTTRIYLTSLTTKIGTPFVRVSLGTEHSYDIERMKVIFIHALEKLRKNRFVSF